MSLVAGVFLVACDNNAREPVAPVRATSELAPLLATHAPPDSSARYIVHLKRAIANPRSRAATLAATYGTTTHHVYEDVFPGFAATLTKQAVLALQRLADVDYIELDRMASTSGTDYTPGWGLDRIDQRLGPLNNQFTSSYDGTGVTIYIVDTGVLSTQADFGGRVTAGWTHSSSYPATLPCNFHGTAVASVAAGSEYGVAKNATIVPVRGSFQCDGWGWVSTWAAGIDWVVQNHTTGPAVMNFSVGAPDIINNLLPGSMNEAVKRAKNDGIFVTVSAGNDGANACGYSPANAMEVVTVGASDIADNRASFSNWGGCIDVFAPGQDILVAQLAGGYNTKSGTSFAAPFVAGVGALLKQRFPTDSPDQIAYMIVTGGTAVLGNLAGSPNRLLYSNVPSLPLVSISGPSTVGVGNFGCSWSADVQGGRMPFTYQWSGIVSGAQSTAHGPIPGSGTLVVDVWDSLGNHAAASFYVTVDPGNPGDPLCTT